MIATKRITKWEQQQETNRIHRIAYRDDLARCFRIVRNMAAGTVSDTACMYGSFRNSSVMEYVCKQMAERGKVKLEKNYVVGIPMIVTII